jgi:hypothetical protein
MAYFQPRYQIGDRVRIKSPCDTISRQFWDRLCVIGYRWGFDTYAEYLLLDAHTRLQVSVCTESEFEPE